MKQKDNTKQEKAKTPSYVRKKRPKWLGFLWLLILVPVVYILVQVIIIMMPRMRTEVAIQEVMADFLELQGFVELESQTVPRTADASGVLYYTVQTGQRVSVGTEVAQLFQSNDAVDAMLELERTNAELALLQNAQQSMSEGGDAEVVLKQIQDGLHNYIDVTDSLDYAQLAVPREEIALANNKLQIATGVAENFNARIAKLEEMKRNFESRVVQAGSVTAPETGYFVPASKQDRVLLGREALEGLTPQKLKDELQKQPQYYDDTVIGHIITDFKWSFFTTVDAKQAEMLPVGKKMEIAFPEHAISGLPIVVKKVDIDETNNVAKIEFLCEYINPDVLALRAEIAEIVFGSKKGLRIDKNALRIIDGNRCVYVKFGNQVFERKIKVLLENENYLLVPLEYEKGVNEIRMYDDVIVDSGGVELYDKKVL